MQLQLPFHHSYIHFFKMKSHSSILAIVFGFSVLNLWLKSDILNLSLLILAGLCLISLTLSNLVERIWIGLAKLLSKIIPNILLSIIYFVVLTPLAIISRTIFNETYLNYNNKSKSFFKNVNKDFSKKSFEKSW